MVIIETPVIYTNDVTVITVCFKQKGSIKCEKSNWAKSYWLIITNDKGSS